MSTVAQQQYTAEEYLALERNAEYKSEYVDGRIYAMTGASREHNLILSLPSLECELPLREIYERVEFDGSERDVRKG